MPEQNRADEKAVTAGKPAVGVGMQMEQVANLACLERLGFGIRVAKSRDQTRRIQAAIERLINDDAAKTKATQFATIAQWDGPRMAAEALMRRYGGDTSTHALSRAARQTPIGEELTI